MFKFYIKILLLTAFIFIGHIYQAYAQCLGGAQYPSGTYTFPGYGTQATRWIYATTISYAGEYVVWNVIKGATYQWSTCSADGGVASYDTQLTLLDASGAYLGVYSDDACGTQSFITWTATYTGTVRVLLNLFSCSTNTTNTTVVGRVSTASTEATCSGGTLGPTYTPTTTFASVGAISSGQYANINVTMGYTYTFSTNAADGGSASYDTKLTLLNATGAVLGPYSDDIASPSNNKSYLVWTATYTGTVRLLLNGFPCTTGVAATVVARRNASTGTPTCNTLYVSAIGGDNGFTPSTPTDLVTAYAIYAANPSIVKQIKLLGGPYNIAQTLPILPNVILDGKYELASDGCAANNMYRKNETLASIITFVPARERVSNTTEHIIGFKGASASGFALIDLNISMSAASGNSPSGNGVSNYAIYLNACSTYDIARCVVNSGSGTSGWSGANGFAGTNGSVGNTNSTTGSCDCYWGCGACAGGAGASAQASVGIGGTGANAGGNGGSGGNGGNGTAGQCGGTNTGNGATGGAGGNGVNGVGSAGSGATAGGVGGGGGGGVSCSCCNGNNGAFGTAGGSGTATAGVTPTTDAYSAGFFVPSAGTNGGGGGGGKGGGGGGGGSGSTDSGTCDRDGGAGGNGGGSGGGGGGGAWGGGGGGGSFAIFTWVNGASSNITDCSTAVGAVGTGGVGGTGGAGGIGGGSTGGKAPCGGGDPGDGGGGGAGGNGGTGGAGGTGRAGAAVAITNQGGGTAPTTSGASVPGTTITVLHNNCTNSIATITKTAATSWVLPSGAIFVNDITSTTASTNAASNTAYITWTSLPAPTLQTLSDGTSNYRAVETITSRTLPTIAASATSICIGGSISFTSSIAGANCYEWTVQQTPVTGLTTPAALFTSTAQNTAAFTPAAVGTYQVRFRLRETCCGWSTYQFLTFTVVADPVNPTLNTKTPNVASICAGQVVSITTNAGSGGVGCTDTYEYTTDGSTWLPYTSGTNITTNSSMATVQIRGVRNNCTTGLDCTVLTPVILATWTIVPDPVNPTLNTKTPNVASVCAGQNVSATINAGTNGIGCSDTYEYTTDGSTWLPYTSGTNIATNPSITTVQMRGVRNNCTTGLDCAVLTPVILATWTVEADPVNPTLNTQTPNVASICAGQVVSITTNAGSGGVGCTDTYEYTTDGSTWLPYTSGTNITTNSSMTTVQIRGVRNNCTTGLDCTVLTPVILATWTIVPDPVNPTLNTQTPNISIVCPGTPVSATFNSGTNGIGCSDVYEYRKNGDAWQTYTPGTNISTVLGDVSVEIQAKRGNCTTGLDCNEPAFATLASWSVGDIVLPTISCVANQIRATNSGVCTYTTIGTEFNPTAYNDNCSGYGISNNYNNSTTLASATFPKGTTTVVWTVTDIVGQTATCSFTVQVNDTELPTINCPSNITTTTNTDGNGDCTVLINSGLGATFADNCSGTVLGYSLSGATSGSGSGSLSSQTFNAGITTITYTATDASSNTVTCAFTVAVTDNEPPTITCPSSVITMANTGQCYAIVNSIAPIFNDNCAGAIVSYAISGATNSIGSSNASGTQFNIGLSTVTYTVTDISGNTATCAFTVNVTDNELPVFNCSYINTTVTLTSGCSQTIVLVPPTVTDNCMAGLTVVGVRDDGLTLADPYPAGISTITWTATDAFSNVAVCKQQIIVVDLVPPQFDICPLADITVAADIGLCMSTSISPTAPTTSDDCTTTTVVGTRGDNMGLNDPYPTGTTIITWVVSDDSGNTTSCTQNVIVNDANPPAMVCASTITINNTPDLCSGTTLLTPPIGNDDCGSFTVLGSTRSDALPSNDPYPVGTTIVTWTGSDGSGNTSTCVQNIVVLDTEPPLFSLGCPLPNFTTSITSNCTANAVVPAPMGTDNCGIFTIVSGVRSDGFLLTDPYPLGTTQIVWTATDGHGNSSTCEQAIIVTDTTPPAFATCPLTSLTASTATCSASVSVSTPTINENCSTTSLVGLRSDNQPLSSAYPIGTTQIVWTVNDASGNYATCTQNVIVTDNTPPAFATCPLAAINLNGTGPGCSAIYAVSNPVVSDNCGTAVVTGVRSDGQLFTAAYPMGTTTITWTATDGGGQTATCSQSVIVSDVISPVFNTCPISNVVLSTTAGSCTASTTITTPTGSDNCGVFNVIGTRSDGQPLSNPFPLGQTYITWAANDGNGNNAVCIQTVLVNDNQAPTFTTCPLPIINGSTNVSTGCSGIVSITTPTASDNCSAVSVVGTRSDGQALNVPYLKGNTIITWKANDAAGNISTCTQVVYITDTTPPVFTCPTSAVTAYTSSNSCTASASVATPTITDNCSAITMSVSRSDGLTWGSIYPFGNTIVTWTATDAAGNTATCSRTVTVLDNVSPTLIGVPANTTVSCPVPSAPTVTTTDNCSATVSMTQTQTAGNCTTGYTITRTWTATDASGNTATQSQTITVLPSTTLAIASYTITHASGTLSNGAISINPTGGTCGGVYTYTWSGPTAWTGAATATGPTITGLPGGYWYCVTVTCGTSTVNACYYVKKTTGRTKAASEIGAEKIEVYPNPFNNIATIAFGVAESEKVKVEIYDLTGRLVTSLFEGEVVNTEIYELVFEPDNLSAGVYICRLTTESGHTLQEKIILQK